MHRISWEELDCMMLDGTIQAPFSALVDLKPNRTWVVTCEHAFAVPGVRQVANGKMAPVIRPKRPEAEN